MNTDVGFVACSQMEKNFDMACLWPKGIGSAEEPRFSLAEGIADFMLAINDTGERALFC